MSLSLFSRSFRSWSFGLSRMACTQRSRGLCNAQRLSPRPSPSTWNSTNISTLYPSRRALSTSTNSEVLHKVVEELEERKDLRDKMYAVVHISGRQFKITSNDLIMVNQIEANTGDEIYLEKVLLVGSSDMTLIGKPVLSDKIVRVKATVTEHTKTAKVIVFKKKRRKNYKKKKGHRQPVTVLRINTIDVKTEGTELEQ